MTLRYPALSKWMLGLLLLPIGGATAATSPPSVDATSRAGAASVPFVRNDGQIDHDDVRFYARLSSGTLFVTESGDLVYDLRAGRVPAAEGTALARWAFRESFVGGNPVDPAGSIPSAVRVRWFKGPRPGDWHASLRAFERVDLGEIYPGVRAELRAAGANVEKILVVSPGANVEDIAIAVQGVDSIALDERHRLVLEMGRDEIAFTAPVGYQVVDGKRESVEVAYAVSGDHYGFRLGEVRPDREVIIDPLLSSTLLGGANPDPPGNYDDDIVHAMIRTAGSVYLAGATQSPDFPIEMGYDETIGGNFPDGFVTRMSDDLSTVLASTYLGTEYSDSVRAMTVDHEGNIVVVGQAGYGFPVTDGAYTYSGTTPVGGGFVSKLSADLSTLVASAVVNPSDFPRAVALGNGGIYFGGSTNNPGFPVTENAYRTDCCPPEGSFGIRPYEGYAGKISSDLTTLEAMTYLNGVAVTGMAVAPDGGVFVADGFDHAVTGYLARFDPNLTQRSAYLSYYPGSESGSSRTYFNDVAVLAGSVYAVGQTYMNDLPATEGAYDTTCGTDGLCDGVGELLVPQSDGFIGKYSHDLQTTQALTYLGGSDHESIRAVALGEGGTVIVTGETTAEDFPTTGNAADPLCGTDGRCNPTGTYGTPQADAFVASLSPDLATLEYGSYLGGSAEDQAYVVAPDGSGNAFVAGFTRSADFPTTPGAFDRTYHGGTSDAFVAKFGEVVPSGPAATPGETCGAGMPQLLVEDFDPGSSTLTVSFVSGCNTTDNNVYFGPLEDVASYGYSGQVCDRGTDGWTTFGLPGGSLFFVLVGDDDVVEGSYGTSSAQAERPAWGTCGFVQDMSEPCGGP